MLSLTLLWWCLYAGVNVVGLVLLPLEASKMPCRMFNAISRHSGMVGVLVVEIGRRHPPNSARALRPDEG